MDRLLTKLQTDFPDFTFIAGGQALWSPQNAQITYCSTSSPENVWSLLHEVGHGILGHDRYASDVDLLTHEVDAWRVAEEVARTYGMEIDREHMQNCLDSYRDWLHVRSTCPSCAQHGLQGVVLEYRCMNCGQAWSVSPERLCRPYRAKINYR